MKTVESLLSSLRSTQTQPSPNFCRYKGALSKEDVDEIGRALSYSLANGLRLEGCSIGDWGAARLCKALAQQKKLTSLELPKNGISGAGLQAFSSLMDTNRTLTTLDLSGNPCETEVPETMIQIALALRRNILLPEVSWVSLSPSPVPAPALFVEEITPFRALAGGQHMGTPPASSISQYGFQQKYSGASTDVERRAELAALNSWREKVTAFTAAIGAALKKLDGGWLAFQRRVEALEGEVTSLKSSHLALEQAQGVDRSALAQLQKEVQQGALSCVQEPVAVGRGMEGPPGDREPTTPREDALSGMPGTMQCQQQRSMGLMAHPVSPCVSSYGSPMPHEPAQLDVNWWQNDQLFAAPGGAGRFPSHGQALPRSLPASPLRRSTSGGAAATGVRSRLFTEYLPASARGSPCMTPGRLESASLWTVPGTPEELDVRSPRREEQALWAGGVEASEDEERSGAGQPPGGEGRLPEEQPRALQLLFQAQQAQVQRLEEEVQKMQEKLSQLTAKGPDSEMPKAELLTLSFSPAAVASQQLLGEPPAEGSLLPPYIPAPKGAGKLRKTEAGRTAERRPPRVRSKEPPSSKGAPLVPPPPAAAPTPNSPALGKPAPKQQPAASRKASLPFSSPPRQPPRTPTDSRASSPAPSPLLRKWTPRVRAAAPLAGSEGGVSPARPPSSLAKANLAACRGSPAGTVPFRAMGRAAAGKGVLLGNVLGGGKVLPMASPARPLERLSSEKEGV